MARKNSSVISDDERDVATSQESRGRSFTEESPLDQRMLDLDDEAESPFLRGQKRVSVRRGALPRNATLRFRFALKLLAAAGVVALVWFGLRQYANQSWRFRLDSTDNITISGINNVTRSQIIEVMASDIDRNVFFVPLATRKRQLEQIPWVQSAAIMRLLPNCLKIAITERTPIAFVDNNSHIELIDANGVIMELPPNQRYSFPIILRTTDAEPLSTRAARMKIYSRFIGDLDSSGAHYSSDISDVDLSDPDDVKATVTDPHGAVLVHLGASNFLEHFQLYMTHVQDWRTQFPNLESVDLRYDHQVIVNPDAVNAPLKPPAASVSAATPASTASEHEHKKAVKKSKKHS